MDTLFEKSYTTQFSTSTYSNCPSSEQLRQLSRVFKDNAINRMFNDCRKALGLPESGTFSSLLPELKLRVMHLLDVRSLMRLASVSRDLYSLAQDELVWKHLLSRDFGKAVVLQCQAKAWKKVYVNLYTARTKAKEHAKGLTLMPEGLLPLRPPTWPPEMIGGDSDLYPHLPPPIFPRGPAQGGALLPLPSLFSPSHPLLVGRPQAANHTRPLLPFPGAISTPPAMYSHPNIPTRNRPPLLPQPNIGRSSLSQPFYHLSLHRHGPGLL